MLRNIATVGVWTAASRVLGFLRDILIAALLGTGPVADAFFVALKLPNLFRRLFGEGAFNAAFVPAFAASLAGEGVAPARRLAEEVASVMVVWLGFLTLLGLLLMPLLMHLLAPGFAADPAKFALSVALSRLTFPYLMLICLAALLSGVLNGINRFAAAAATPVVFNIALIGALVLIPPGVLPRGQALAIGVTVSGMAQLGLLAIALSRGGMALRLRAPRLTAGVRVVLRRMGPGILGAGVTQINVAVDTIIASLLPAGTVSVLYYADRVNQLPLGTIGTAVGTALLPLLARQIRAQALVELRATLNQALALALALTLPAAFALMLLAEPIMLALFRHGALSGAAAAKSAAALAAYAIGLPAFVLAKLFSPGFFARGDTKTPVKIGVIAVFLNLALNLALMRPLGYLGPPLATSLAAFFNAFALALLLARAGHFGPDRALLGRIGRILAAALAMVLALALARAAILHAWPGLLANPLGAIALLAGLIPFGLLCYGGAGLGLGAFTLDWLRGMLRRRSRV